MKSGKTVEDDKIKILEDTDGDGKGRLRLTFLPRLNISHQHHAK